MAKYVIEGGVPLRGKVKIPGAKNAGFKLMVASLLSDDMSTLSNIPYIRDVIAVREIIGALGGKVEIFDNTAQISGSVSKWQLPEELGLKSRASFMYLPILLHRFKKAKVPVPVGDKIGDRPINWFLEGLQKMGAKVKKGDGLIEASSTRGLVGTRYKFPKNSHTGTEALLMAASLAKGKTILENAASEPEVDDLISFLNQMGAKIKRGPERAIEIEGANSLKGALHTVMPDRNETVTFGCMAIGTKGEIEVENANANHVKAFIEKVKHAGEIIEIKNSLKFVYKRGLKSTNVTTSAYPGFMTDWQSLWTALMTQANGESTVHETIFENRFGYVPNLVKMGGKIELYSPKVGNPEKVYNFEWDEQSSKLPHAAKISGPTKLRGGNISISDIRAGATLVLAALMAEGRSEIYGIEHLERGYDDLGGRLERLGARIRKVD